MEQPKKTTRPTTVRFDPERAITTLELNGLDQISESLAFWASRLAQAHCPGCGTKASLLCDIMPHGVEIVCRRGASDRCDYAQEIIFGERAI